jgi:Mce-associated membrane protein
VTDDVHDLESEAAAAEVEAAVPEKKVEPEVPETTVEEPEADAEEPETDAEEPETDAEEPETDAEEPETDVEEPETDAEEPETDAEEPETDAEDQAPAPVKRSRFRRPRRPRLPRVLGNSRVVTAILVVLLLISGGAASWIYFKQYRPDQQTDPSVKQAVASSASDGTTALLSYSADSLDQDFASAKSHLAGDFLSYYTQFTQQSVGPTAKERSMKTTARVTGAAVSELHPDSAVVLVFVDQTTTTKDSPQPSLVISNVLVTMTRINGKWLITKFNPI